MEADGHMPVWSGQRIERTHARGRDTYCTPFKVWVVEQAMQPGISVSALGAEQSGQCQSVAALDATARPSRRSPERRALAVAGDRRCAAGADSIRSGHGQPDGADRVGRRTRGCGSWRATPT
jgi:hypothetical protein